MSEPITALPPTRHTNAKLHHETACDDLCKAIEESELKPLLPLLKNEIPPDDSAGHLAFAKLFEIIRQQPDFEQKYYDDVPDVIKPFIEQYAFPSEQTERKAVLQNNLPHAPPKVTSSNSLLGGLEKVVGSITGQGSLPEAPLPGQSVPLPPSPHFRRFALQLAKKLAPFPDIKEGDGKPMERVPSGTEFENWGQNVKHLPSDTFVARTEVGLCNLVKWAKAKGKTVRVAGYRHTWTDFFAQDGQVVVMLLPLKTLTELPAYSPTLQEIQKDSDLVGIELAPRPFIDSDTTLCTIKAGTTNDMFRIWAFENKRWCLPINTIMVEMTLGGSNSPICHGSGFSTTTLSDLVSEFHYVDPDGNPKTISDPDQLRAAAGCFGLLGICTALTLRLDKMTMAVMNPVKLPLALAIPPPAGYKIPSAVDMRGITPEKLEEARLAFIKRCEEDFYLEWFWFPLTSEVWVNTWNRYDAGSFDSLHPYPSALDSIVQWVSGWVAEELINSWAFKLLSGRLQALAVAVPALAQMPDLPDSKDAVKTLFSEAIHFRRGIQNTRCLDTEWEIPIPEDPKTPKKRDYGLIQRAWWDAISAFYSRDDTPMRLTLEMRLTGGSNMILAPQRGNDFGTISIEVLTIPTTPEKEWQSFMQQVADAWTSYTDSKGNLLNARPHWAKQWKDLTVHGQPIEKYLKETAYKDAIPEFRDTLEKIAAAQGTTVGAMRERFGNPLLERLFFAP